MKYCEYCMSQIEDNNKCQFCGKEPNNETPTHHLIPGTILNNKYYVGASIGEGGFGITYIGRDLNLDIKVAVKEYYPNGYVNRANTDTLTVSCGASAENKDFFDKGKERFLREARILAKFSGAPGIVDVRDFFEDNNTAYIVMEYLDGETLRDYLKRQGTMSPENAIRLLMPVMVSLKKVHEQGLIHRDISPDNIMIINNQVKLLDFGAARDVSNKGNKSLSVMLKPGYAPEEQYRSKGEQGPWTDIYALCATLYKCITGIRPDDSTQRVYSDELKTPSSLGISIDSNIENAIMKGLSVLQRDRYQTIDELMDGFKGLDFNRNSNNKTANAGMTVSKDDNETMYIDEDNNKTVFDKSMVNQTDDTPVYRPVNAPKYKETAKQVNRPAANTPSTPSLNVKAKPISANRPKKKKRIGIIILSSSLVLVAIIAMATIFSALNSKTISGEKISINAKKLRLIDENVTVEDMKEIISLGKLEELSFIACKFDEGAFNYLGDIPTYLKSLSIYECSGITDYSCISNLKYLTQLIIDGCGLTNEQFSKIELGNKDYLTQLNLKNNEELSDLKPLAGIADTLTELNVNNTSVSDFSCLKDSSLLYNLSANNCKITSLSSLTNKTIAYLYVNDNQLSDISAAVNYEYLRTFEASNNQLSDITALSGHKALSTLQLDNNKIADISSLSECTQLLWLQINDNQIESLLPLANCSRLKYLYINRNKLTSFNGLQKVIELEVIQAAGNNISSLDGISNCSIIEDINLNGNHNISDISILAKSAKTLKTVYLNDNKVSDISALLGTTALEYLSLDNNQVTTLDPLKQSTALISISADRNAITSIAGIENSTKLKYIYLPHNKISDMSAISNLVPRAENDFAIIDLSSNNISEIKLTSDKEYTYFAIYNNPIKSFDTISSIKGSYFLFSYVDGVDCSAFEESFNYYKVVDCPLDKQVEIKEALKAGYSQSKVRFQSVEEADEETESLKMQKSTGNDDAETEENTEQETIEE